MAIFKTLNFLPAVFQTETNQKFLNATMDQLVTEPNLIPINGYIGRKFAPGFTDISTYLREPSLDRADYQLEPAVVVKDQVTGNVELSATYPEVMQKIGVFGGNVSDPNKLFSSDYYSYNPNINLDAYINFGQYYWLPNGPDAVDVYAGSVELEKTYYPTINLIDYTYNFNGFGTISNPDLTLARGGTYTFNLNSQNSPFWIQTDPGVSGKQIKNNNLSSRQVLGVTNNGDDVGTVTFSVPLKTAQDFYINMPVVQNVDLVTTLKYTDIQGQLLSVFNTNYGGIDGQRSNLNGKLLIFGQPYISDSDWTVGSTTVPSNERYGIWQIQLVPSGSDSTFNLIYFGAIPKNNKVLIQSGIEFGNTQWYTDASNNLLEIPIITANLDTLYYQNGNNANGVGVIKLVDPGSNSINVTTEILGKQNYISPNGVEFTNGLKIKFDVNVTPTEYQNKEYYVEGVGTSIVLVDVTDLLVNYAINLSNFNPALVFVEPATAKLNNSQEQITITTNDLPSSGNVKYGTFPNSANPNYVVEQNLTFNYPYRAGQNSQGEHNSILLSETTIGVTIPGILLSTPVNGWSVPGASGTTWHYNSVSVQINGQDAYGGRPTDNGAYRYEDSAFITANAWGNVSGFTAAEGGYLNTDGHSKIIGFAADGYPIYGPFGYQNPADSTSSIVRMRSSYASNPSGSGRPASQTVTLTANCISGNTLTVSSTFGINPGMRITTNSGGLAQNQYWVINNGLATASGVPAYTQGTNQITLNSNVTLSAGTLLTFEFLSGAFIEDYTYSAGSGTLDQYNGRYCVTPEFPTGTYAYFATQDSSNKPVYPYFVGAAFYGSEVIDTNSSLTTPDYLIINRASRDLNPWTRRNRWFHHDVIAATARYNNVPFVLDQDFRAVRPIIEFNPNLQLFDFGKNGIQPVDLINFSISQPFSQVEGATGIFIDGVNVVEGMRIIFGGDEDYTTRNKIWVVSFIDPDGLTTTQPVIHLTLAADGNVVENDTVSIFNGLENVGKSFWFNGTEWNEGQTKTAVNQAPLFDVFDSAGISLGNKSKYPQANNLTAFNGTKIFSYKEGTGTVDSVLGFPLTYKSFNNVGDIQFDNNFDTDTFSYSVDRVDTTEKVNIGFLYQNNADGTVTKLNCWTPVVLPTRQYQDISYIYDGINNLFNIDVTPAADTDIPNLSVYVNFKSLSSDKYQVYNLPENKKQININPQYIKENDKIDILVYSTEVSVKGYYQIPDNLNYNAQNLTLTAPTLGEMRNHIKKLTQNSLVFKGNFPGDSNLRDIVVTAQGGTMLQQSAPSTFASLFLTSEQYNFVNSVLYAQQEYTKFKNKFLSLAESSSNAANINPITAVDNILLTINQIKNQTFPYYYSDMVPYGRNINNISYTVFDPAQTNYEITSLFSMSSLSNKAVLVYVNQVQKLYGYDYTFLADAPGIKFTTAAGLAIGDVINIIEYQNTDANYIPETPTKLGLYPKFKPEIFTDDTYLTPQTFIRGHDGSLTPIYGDFRDNLILELEKRIYNNIKVEYNDKLVNIYESKPGKFRTNSFSFIDYQRLTSRVFLPWVGFNRLNYTKNDSFSLENSFTFNYGKALDVIDGATLPGSWRACFEYFYDTQHPHTRPWEMLGFSERPDWWVSTYGPAPYTSGNKILWDDLEAGYIAGGTRIGYDPLFARPGLSNIIPVSPNGDLVSPLGLLTTKYYQDNFSDSWKVGQYGPVETAWTNSSEYPYAVQILCGITNPAKYFSYGIATNKYKYDTDLNQYLVTTTNQRITQSDIVVNGNTYTGSVERAAGYLNWITDYQTGLGIPDRNLTAQFVKTYELQLCYRMAGYSSKDRIKILAEQNSPNSVNQSIIVPDENYDLVLHKSTPLANLRYSAVQIEKTATGFVVSGYDNNNPYFSIVVPAGTGPYTTIKVLDKDVKYYTSFTNNGARIAYGTEFTTLQELAVFLSGYEQYLNLQGFRFDYFDNDLGEIRNWQLSCKEFLFWAQQGWQAESVLVLGPFADRVKIICRNWTIDGITNTFYGTKVMNQNYLMLDTDAYTVQRDSVNNTFRLTLDNANGNMIGFISVNAVQIEHVLLFDNRTQFNDIIYDPAQGQRQFRLKLVGYKSGGWNGALSVEGYMYNSPGVPLWQENKDYLIGDLIEYKNFYYAAKDDIVGSDTFNFNEWLPVDKNKIKTGLINNFATDAGLAEDFYDTDRVNLESDFDLYSLGLIGFRNRSYLNDLGVDDTSQVKFYQGFIKQKGTRNAINAMANVSFNGQPSAVTVNEEWAFRVGTYGSLETNQYVEMVLNDAYVLSNPTSLEVTANNSVIYSSIYTDKEGLYKSAKTPFSSPFFLNRDANSNYSDDIKTAGFVNIEDSDWTIFDIADITTLNTSASSIAIGDTIWVAKDFNQDWNIYRVNTTPSSVIKFTNALDGKIQVETNVYHNLTVDDVLLIPNLEEFSGFYRVDYINGITSFTVTYSGPVSLNGFNSRIFQSAPIYKLSSIRLDYASQIVLNTPIGGFKANDKAWINYNNVSSEWATYEKSEPWEIDSPLPRGISTVNGNFGQSVKLSNDNNFAAVGEPGYDGNIGSVTTYVLSFENTLIENLSVSSPVLTGTQKLGFSVDYGTDYIIAGAPGSYSNKGYVFVYKRDYQGTINQHQILAPNTAIAEQFGYSVAISNDDQWMYVGAPGADSVYVYGFNSDVTEESDNIVANGVGTTYTLGFTPVAQDLLTLSGTNKDYVPNVHFTLSGSTVTFTSAPPAGNIVARQAPGFVYIDKITSANAGSAFGYSVVCATDGAQFAAGAPLDIANTISGNALTAGTVSLYDRTIDNYIAGEGQYLFGGIRPILNISKVYAGSNLQTLGTDYVIVASTWVSFITPPGAGVIVSIETDDFNLIETTAADAPAQGARFGYSIDICPNNCSLYVGSPYYNGANNQFQVGQVYRFVNQGRVYGNITGTKVVSPTVTVANTASAPTANITLTSVNNLSVGMNVVVGNNVPSSANITAINGNTITLSSNITGTVSSGQTIQFSTLTSGDSVRLNDFVVEFVDITLEGVVTKINNSNLPGITASNVGGYLHLTTSSVASANKLRCLPSTGNALIDLGLDVFVQTEEIANPTATPYDHFGYVVNIDSSSSILGVGSPDAATLESTTFDVYAQLNPNSEQIYGTKYTTNTTGAKSVTPTTFDGKSTTFTDYVQSGAIWMMTYLNDARNNITHSGRFAFVEQLTPSKLNFNLVPGAQFGRSIDIVNYELLIGSPGDSSIEQNGGRVYQFNNANRLKGWDVIRYQEPKVDINGIIKNYIYSAADQTIINNLDYIDPAKGKILGIAEQEITYKTDYDPAVYNNTTDTELSSSSTFYWNDNQVGEVWWDLSTVRYVEYEQGSIKYRTSNWGRAFTGSRIDVYEWVESLYPPSQYVLNGGDGVPKYPDNSAYVTLTYVDPNTNEATVRYYFWVKDKTTVDPELANRSVPVVVVADYIQNPKSSGVKYLAAIRDDSVAVYNVLGIPTGKDVILHVDYSTKINNTNIIHSEYALLNETNTNPALIPTNIYNKLVDSASGLDVYGNPVPDPTLPVQTRYGINIRPRQSMFVDKNKAVEEMVTYVNSVFAKNIISQGFDLSTLSSGEPIPPANSGYYDVSVNNIEELGYINITVQPVGYQVLVLSDTTTGGLWTIYTKQSNNTWLLTRVQSYYTPDYWQYTDWYATGFDSGTIPTFTVGTFADMAKLRLKSGNIVKVLNNGQGKWTLQQVFPNVTLTVGLQDGTIALTENLYNSEKYGLSFGTDLFDTNRFDQNPGIEIRKILDALRNELFVNQLSQDFLELFFVFIYYVLDEQKYVDWVFKTSFISVLHKIRGLDQPQIYAKENQEYYRQYIEEVKPYHTTIREYISDYEGSDNVNLYTSDFDVPATYDPVLQVYRSPSGQFVQDATLLQQPQYADWLANYPSVIGEIIIADSGSGYTVAPQVTITGSSIGNDALARALITNGVVSKIEIIYPGSNYITQPVVTISGGDGTGARAYAKLKNETVRKLSTTLTYDRITYSSQVQIWTANTAYSQGDIITYNNVAYIANRDFTSGATFLGNDLSFYPAYNFNNANDRIAAYYNPSTGMPGKDYALLQSGIDYPGVTVEGPLFTDSGGFDSSGFDTTAFDPLSIDSDGTYVISDAILDTKITSSYTDSTLGTRPEDIIVDGGPYVYPTFTAWTANTTYYQGDLVSYDNKVYYVVQTFTGNSSFDSTYLTNYDVGPYASHAPEELVPGRVYDTLDMTITTFATNAAAAAYSNWVSTDGFEISSVVVGSAGAGYSANTVNVTISGTTGTGATASATVDPTTGAITAITVISSGTGFTTVPNVVITGANTSPATASVRMTQANFNTFEYRVFKDMNDVNRYYRINDGAITTLAANLSLTDTTIVVANSAVLSTPSPSAGVPGVVFIDGERITYYTKNDGTNTLGQIRRGTAGTGAKVHLAGVQVVDSSASEEVPYSRHYNWTPNANVSSVTTSGEIFTFIANVAYSRSQLWYSEGSSPTTLIAEPFVANTVANLITTESSIDIATDGNYPSPTNGDGLYTSSTIQAVFVKQA